MYYIFLCLIISLLAEERTPMTFQEAWITNQRYTNEDVIWGRPKGLRIGNIVGTGDEQKANLYPDGAAIHFVANIKLKFGWKLTIRGQYPHARYFSFTIANQLGNGQLGNGKFIRDDQIIPDPGSVNPYLLNNTRNVANRNYTIYLIQGDAPGYNVSNTLFIGEDNTRIHFTFRVYLVDVGYDGTGVVKLDDDTHNGLPVVYLNDKITGSSLLDLLNVEKTGDPNGYELKQWISQVSQSDDQINAPCINAPLAQVFWNVNYSVTGLFYSLHPEKRVRDYPPNDDGGFANNPDTKYVSISYSFNYGEVFVVRGRKPSHPFTRNGESMLAETEVQYFSVSTAAGPSSGEGWDTAYDEQITVDKYGDYTVVVSWPWNRPYNAVSANNITWLSPGDGEGHYVGARNWVGVLYIRYQNPNPAWKHSPANIPMPTQDDPIPKDSIIMGPYYPISYYSTRVDFERSF